MCDVSWVRCEKRGFYAEDFPVALQLKWLERDISRTIFDALKNMGKAIYSDLFHPMALSNREWFLNPDVGVPYFTPSRAPVLRFEVRMKAPISIMSIPLIIE